MLPKLAESQRAPLAVYRPLAAARWLPFGRWSIAAWVVAIGIVAALVLGVGRVVQHPTIDAVVDNQLLLWVSGGVVVVLLVAAVGPGLLHRREVRVYRDRVDVVEGPGVTSVPRADIVKVSMYTTKGTGLEEIELRYRDGSVEVISGWLLGEQIRLLARRLVNGT